MAAHPKPLKLWDRDNGKAVEEFMLDHQTTYETRPLRAPVGRSARLLPRHLGGRLPPTMRGHGRTAPCRAGDALTARRASGRAGPPGLRLGQERIIVVEPGKSAKIAG